MSVQARTASAVVRTALVVVALLGAAAVAAAPASASTTEATFAQNAATYAALHGYRTGIAVLDTRTGRYYGGGDDGGVFASESVVKTMIATRLLVTGQMRSPAIASTAWLMITQSDDFAASSLYGRVGGDGLIDWIKATYNVPFLGYGPSRAGWWGNTHITPRGLVYFYAAIKRDSRVAPWLFDAMRHITEYGSDHQYQWFGLPSATSGAAVKQGWGTDLEGPANASFNTTGMVDGDRYAVAMLMRSAISTYGRAISDMLTRTARAALPGGHVYDPAAHDPRFSVRTVQVTGSHVYLLGVVYDPDDPRTNAVTLYEGASRRATTIASIHNWFSFSFDTTNGRHGYCLVAVNKGLGDDVRQCITVTVNGAPLGYLDAVTSPAPGAVSLVGWAVDRDAMTQPAMVRVTEDGVVLGDFPTSVARDDVNRVYRTSGVHGFALTLTGRAAGDHTYRVIALNSGYPGPDVELAHSPVVVTVAPSTVPPPPGPGQAPVRNPARGPAPAAPPVTGAGAATASGSATP